MSLPSWRLAGGQSFNARVVDKEAAFTRIEPAAAVTLPARSMTVLRYQRGEAQHTRK